MGRYDSPGFQNQLPGFAPRPSHDHGAAPGSAPSAPPSPVATIESGLPGVGSVVPQHGSAVVLQPGQYPAHEPFTGMPLDGTGAGHGNAGHNPHPNAAGLNPDA
jgi:hypothetical protein